MKPPKFISEYKPLWLALVVVGILYGIVSYIYHLGYKEGYLSGTVAEAVRSQAELEEFRKKVTYTRCEVDLPIPCAEFKDKDLPYSNGG